MTEWWRSAVFYQIYPLSFHDANGDGTGDLAGILEKLDHVARLGVDAVWLSPFFRSPMKDFGYDVSDYRDVDPRFGALDDFDRVLHRAHALGLKLIIDQVWSHTSDQHPWFVESAASRDNPRADWYVWADPKPDGAPPNNWQASFGGPSWTWSPRRRQYYLHNFLPSQPDLNYWSPQVQEEILAIARFWLDRGIDGFRLDVINYLFHDRALTDNPVAAYRARPATPTEHQAHVHDRSRPETLDFVSRIRGVLDSYGDRVALGEIFDQDMLARQIEYTNPPNGLHTAYSFFLLHTRRCAPALFQEALAAWADAPGWPAWSLSNHDVPRFATRLAGDDPARVRTILAILLTLRGAPFLYQGDELGLPQAEVPFDALRDPFAIATYTGDAFRDGARTPMPWRAGAPHAGFSEAPRTWLPLDPRHAPLAADAQEADPDSVLHFTRTLIAMRRERPALQRGDARPIPGPEGVLAYVRAYEGQRVLCAFNLGEEEAVIRAPELAGAMLLNTPGQRGALSSDALHLAPSAYAFAELA